MENIDVQKIMEGIRKEIADQGYTEEEISYAQSLANMGSVRSDKYYNPRTLRMKYEYVRGHCDNPICFELKGSPIKMLFQKAIRRVFLFVIFPAFHFQNTYNKAVADCIGQMKNYIEENEQVRHMAVKVTALEKQVKEQQEQINVLREELSSFISAGERSEEGKHYEIEF